MACPRSSSTRELDLTSVFLETEVSMRELLQMKPGDILPIEMPKTAVVRSGARPLLRGKFGLSRGYNAVSVLEAVKSPSLKPEENHSMSADKASRTQPNSRSCRDGAGGAGQLNLDLIMDVRLMLTLEVGRTRISVRNLLALTQGSVVELDKLAGEPLDVLVNGTLVAHGEVVVVNDKFGIRLLDVVSPEKRVESLKE